MTGILPIAKYSSGSEINMFKEYDMATKEKFSEYSEFLDSEVDYLFEVYRQTTENAKITREDLKKWYDGYLKLLGYAATSTELHTKKQIFSAMVVYGLLTYEDGEVFIPNRELMDKYDELLLSNENLGYIHNLAKESEKMRMH